MSIGLRRECVIVLIAAAFAVPHLTSGLISSVATAQCSRAKPRPPGQKEAPHKVTAAQLKYLKSGREGKCPADFFEEGAITTDGPVEVKYTWVSSDGRDWPVHTLKFTARGTSSKTVSVTWHVGKPGEKVNVWLQLKVIAPNEVLSNRSGFHVICIK